MSDPQEGPAFTASYRVRFDESGPDGLVRSGSLLRYAQDIAWLHSEARGFDRRWYGERRLVWLVRAARLEVSARIPMGSLVEVATHVVGWRKVWARRLVRVALGDATPAARIVTDWVLVDAAGVPKRIPVAFEDAFSGVPLREPISRVELPAAPADTRAVTFRVRPQELDPNDHVNNAVYVDWLEEAIDRAGPDGAARPRGMGPTVTRALPRRYRLEYAAAARGGQEITAAIWPDGRGWWCRMTAAGVGDVIRAHADVPESSRA